MEIHIHTYIHIIFKAVLTQRSRMIEKDENIRDHSAWTIGNVDPMHEMCIPHSIRCAWEQQRGRKTKKQTQE